MRLSTAEIRRRGYVSIPALKSYSNRTLWAKEGFFLEVFDDGYAAPILLVQRKDKECRIRTVSDIAKAETALLGIRP